MILKPFWRKAPDTVHFATARADRDICGTRYRDGDYLVFGSESKGLDDEILRRFRDHCVRIPMREGARSLNLSNSVAVVLYEALRCQNGFMGLT